MTRMNLLYAAVICENVVKIAVCHTLHFNIIPDNTSVLSDQNGNLIGQPFLEKTNYSQPARYKYAILTIKY